ncbi:MAG: DUF3786 domain-containing protein [Chloroflexi bacterium]|nr:DUF3786 domain-containing protein [Chloroflexota bacterium]
MPLDPAYNKAVQDLRRLSPYVAANRAGVVFDGHEFRVPFFNRVFVVRYPEVEVLELASDSAKSVGASFGGRTPLREPEDNACGDQTHPGGSSPLPVSTEFKPVSLWLQIVVLHYLITANGAPIADQWITFRELPGGYIYEKAFAGRAVEPLERAFGRDLPGFKRAGESLGGVKMDRTGDAAHWFMAFPRVRLGCILFLADEEMPASINILFDKAASDYLATEDLSAVGGYLSAALVRA